MSRLTCSLIFALVSSTAASAQSLTTLTSLTNGEFPWGSVVIDANGNLFGTTELGGASGVGTVFEIARTSTGYAGTPTTLFSFDNTNGAFPLAGLIVDANGNLFGTTQSGGAYGDGTVFEIVNSGGVYASAPTTLVSFNNTNGGIPEAGLLADASGNLFGTTAVGGAYEAGTVFEIVKTSSGYASTPTTLVSFKGSDGEIPQARLLADSNGNLFGTTDVGGAYGYGTVFEIVKTSGGYANAPTTLVNFDNTNGAIPEAGLIADTNGNLFGTTAVGGAYGFGTVFEIANSGGVYAGTPTTLYSFNGSDGSNPPTGLTADALGNLFGTASQGGSNNTGTVFEITGSGFTPAKRVAGPPNPFSGTPGSANCIGKTTSSLAHTYGGIAHAAPALGYASVSALQSAIAIYCSK